MKSLRKQRGAIALAAPGRGVNESLCTREPWSNGGIVLCLSIDHQRAALPESQRYVAVKVCTKLQNEPRAIAALQHEYRHRSLVASEHREVYDFHQAEGVSFLA